MRYTIDQVKNTLSDYLEFTEPELIFGFNKTVYEITATPEGCSLSALNKRFDVVDISFEELFIPNNEILGTPL